MELSVITVVYNDCLGVKKTLDSIKRFVKDFKYELELIIINGNSTDRTHSVITNFIGGFDNVRIVYLNEPDNGIYDAMNKGVANCSNDSEFCIFMNSGDCFNHHAACVISKFFGDDRKLPDIAIFPIESVNQNGKAIRIRKFNNAAQLRKMPAVPHQSTLIRTNLMKSMLYDLRYKILADYDFFCKCYVQKVPIEYVETLPIAVFLQGGISNSYVKQLSIISELSRIQKSNFNEISYRYLFVPLFKWTFFRFSAFRKLESLFRKFI